MKMTVSLKEVNRFMASQARMVAIVTKVAGKELSFIPELPAEVTKQDVIKWLMETNQAFDTMPGGLKGGINVSLEEGDADELSITLEYTEEFVFSMLDVTDEIVGVVGEIVEKKKFSIMIAVGGMKALYHMVKPMAINVLEPLKDAGEEVITKIVGVFMNHGKLESEEEVGTEVAATEE